MTQGSDESRSTSHRSQGINHFRKKPVKPQTAISNGTHCKKRPKCCHRPLNIQIKLEVFCTRRKQLWFKKKQVGLLMLQMLIYGAQVPLKYPSINLSCTGQYLRSSLFPRAAKGHISLLFLFYCHIGDSLGVCSCTSQIYLSRWTNLQELFTVLLNSGVLELLMVSAYLQPNYLRLQ